MFDGPPSAGFFNLPAASGEECPSRKVFVRLEAGVSPKLAGGARGGRTGGAPGESRPSRGRARLTRAGCSCVHAPGGRVGTRFAGGFLVVLEVACLSPDGPCCDRAASLSISGPGEQSQESLLKANGQQEGIWEGTHCPSRCLLIAPRISVLLEGTTRRLSGHTGAPHRQLLPSAGTLLGWLARPSGPRNALQGRAPPPLPPLLPAPGS